MIVYGKQVVLRLSEFHKERVKAVYLAKEIDSKTFSMIAKTAPVLRVDFKKAQAMAKGGNHQGFLAEILPPEPALFDDVKRCDRILVLCGITDVGNVGGIFRSAYCLGVEGIIIASSSISLEGVMRTSAGAMADLPFCMRKNVFDVIHELKNENLRCYGADSRGKDVRDETIEKRWALFLGSEGEGLSGKILSKLDTILSIKMKKNFNSLNVSVAAGILMNRMC